jgi:hypothetical protein
MPIDTVHRGIFISKFSADGQNLLFSTFFGGSDVDRLTDINSDDAGNVYLAGITRSVDLPTTPGTYSPNFVGGINECEEGFPGHPVNCEDFFIFRMSTSGEGIAWGTYLGGTNIDKARGIACDALGNVFVVGYTTSEDFPFYDGNFGAAFVVCKLTGDGSSLEYTRWVESGSANYGNGIFVDGMNDIYFTGTVGVPASIYISKLQGDQTTAVDDGQVVALADFALAANYPNPFNPRTSISFTLPAGAEGGSVNLSIFDAAGHRVRRLLDDRLGAGEHSVEWSGRDDAGRAVSAGVYYAHLTWAGESRTRPMVLLK